MSPLTPAFRLSPGKLWIASIVALSVACAIALAQSPVRKTPAVPSTPVSQQQSEYVDTSVCAQCHQQIARSYAATGMGQSFSKPDVNVLASQFNGAVVDNETSGMRYTLVTHDGNLYERRSQAGYRGAESNALEERVDYVVGSGNHAHTFLHRDSQGKLIELPVSWYSEGSGYWAMSPGFDRHDQEDFRRAIPAECMFCHNAYPEQMSAASLAAANAPAFPEKLPMGIDCQRCHGPGRAHVKAAMSGADIEVIRKAIVNPAKLSRDRQLDVCMQCHLETSSSHMPNEIRRFDRTVFSYRPGQDLGDYKIYLDPASNVRDDRFEIAHAAYRLRMSACFKQSQMTCLTCHDPHISYRDSNSTARYISACKGCHQNVTHRAELGQRNNCLDCHMPKRRTDDAVHVVMTDHYIQRNKPDRDLIAPHPESDTKSHDAGGVSLYYPTKLSLSTESELYLAMAKAKEEDASPQAISEFRTAMVKYAPKQSEFYYELAHALYSAQVYSEAVHWYQEALLRRPFYPQASKELAVSLMLQNRKAEAKVVLQQAIAKSPRDAQLLADLGDLELHSGNLDEAQRLELHALQINPALPEAENSLGLIAIDKKNGSGAEKWLRAAIRDNPSFTDAHNNFGRLLSSQGDYEQAAYEYQQAIASKPNNAAAHHGYGLMLELQRSYDQAAEEFKQACDLDGTDPEMHGDYADLLAARGQLAEAEEQYSIALRAASGSAELHSSLGGVLAAEGKQDQAQKELEKAVKLEGNLFQAHLQLSILLYKSGNVAEARVHCQKAAQSPDPDLRNAATTLLQQMAK